MSAHPTISCSSALLKQFNEELYQFYHTSRRQFQWRYVEDPYKVVVSEFMLQQTQTVRVVPKYAQFLQCFPTIQSLAHASLKEILTVWQGLGYNRRAQYLHAMAIAVCNNHGGVIPSDREHLQKLPGIGKATAGAICAFAYNIPVVFIETNIRSVFLHYFFAERSEVSDADIFPFIDATLDRNNPREWYYALMDKGVYLKKQYMNPNRKSAHYTVQSPFKGSIREIRGAIIAQLIKSPEGMTLQELSYVCDKSSSVLQGVIAKLLYEGLILQRDQLFFISDSPVVL